MSANLAKIMLIGRVGKEPELKMTPSGTAILSFSLATDRTRKDKDGSKQKSTSWWNIAMFGKKAEIGGKWIAKGKTVYIEGDVEIQEFTGKDGTKQRSVKVSATDFQLLGGDRSSGEMDEVAAPAPGKTQAGGYDDTDDIPF